MGEASSLLGKFDNCDGAWGRALAEVKLQEAAQHGGAAPPLSDLGGRRPDASGDGRAVAAPAPAAPATARTPADDAWAEAVRGAGQQQKRAADDGGSASSGGDRQRSSDGGARGRAEMSDRATAVEAATRSHMPATREWMSGSSSKLDSDTLKRLVLEVSLLNKEKWSPGTMATPPATGEQSQRRRRQPRRRRERRPTTPGPRQYEERGSSRSEPLTTAVARVRAAIGSAAATAALAAAPR